MVCSGVFFSALEDQLASVWGLSCYLSIKEAVLVVWLGLFFCKKGCPQVRNKEFAGKKHKRWPDIARLLP